MVRRTVNNWRSTCSFLASSTHGTWSDANFDYVSACQDQLFDHLRCHDITSDNRFVRPLSASSLDEVHEKLRVSVGHVDAHVLEQRSDLQDFICFLEVGVARSRAHCDILWRQETVGHSFSSITSRLLTSKMSLCSLANCFHSSTV